MRWFLVSTMVLATGLACGGGPVGVCEPGRLACSGDVLSQCDDLGQWQFYSDCAALGATCDPVLATCAGRPPAPAPAAPAPKPKPAKKKPAAEAPMRICDGYERICSGEMATELFVCGEDGAFHFVEDCQDRGEFWYCDDEVGSCAFGD